MVSSSAKTVAAYLRELPAERRAAIQTVRKTILDNLPAGYEESMQFGMIAYCVPLAVYPETYNRKPLLYAALAAQKHHMAVYLSGIHGDRKLARWFEAEYRKTGKRIDIGKSCVRFRRIEDLPVGLVGQAIAAVPMEEFITIYERSRPEKG